MSRNIPGLILAYVATSVILARTVVKFGASDGSVAQATAEGDLSIGVSTDIASASGETCDVIRTGIAPVYYAGNITRGDPLSVTAAGRVLSALGQVAAGERIRIIGYAEVSGVSGDIGSMLIAPGFITEPAADEP
jgi:hypothetical protein